MGSQVAQDGRIMDIAEVSVLRDGREVANLRPRRDFFPTAQDLNTMTIAGSHSTLENDFYVLLVSWEPVSHETATFKVYVNPLVNLVWWGGIFLVLGTAISAYPNIALPARMREEIRLKGRAGAKA
jgi:cytochrome c-type biogenesis protein CcmF